LIIGRMALRVMRKAAVRLVCRTVSQASSSIWMARPSAVTPALLTSASTGAPSCSSAWSKSSLGAPLATSPWIATALPPASVIASTVRSAPSLSER
jgi:hypothetical protein